MATKSKIQELKVETYNQLSQLQGWGLLILRHELELTQVRIIQAGGTIPDVNGSEGTSVIEKRLLLRDIVSWVPDIDKETEKETAEQTGKQINIETEEEVMA